MANIKSRLWQVETRANLSGFYRMEKDIKDGLVKAVNVPGNPYSEAMSRVGETYREFLYERYEDNKTGGGSWPAITERTFQWRRMVHGLEHRDILSVTGTLQKVTHKRYDPSKAHYEKRTKYGITVGVAGGRRHPDFPGTIYQLIQFHANGDPTRNIPIRKIIVEPNTATIRKIGKLFLNAHTAAIKAANAAVT